MNSVDVMKCENLSILSDEFVIRWNITYLCNYQCDFCIQGPKTTHIDKAKGESSQIRKEICENLIKFIETKINGKFSKLKVCLIGGEVTILKDFIEILERIVKCDFHGEMEVHITTNLSANMETLKKLCNIFNRKYDYPRKLIIGASYYKQFTTEKEFMRKIKLICSNGKINLLYLLTKNKKLDKWIRRHILHLPVINVSIAYPLCNDLDYEEYLTFKSKYQKFVKKMNYIIIRDYKESISNELKNKLKEQDDNKRIRVTLTNGEVYYFNSTQRIGLILDNEQYFNPNGYICDIGMKNISIAPNGDLSKCPSNVVNTTYGNIRDGISNLQFEKMKCTSNRCICGFYRTIEKDN